ncbi:MAG: sodium:solute symporter [Paludibacter sp.]|nr:sodium:solute symporter [Paludibacter sp.]
MSGLSILLIIAVYFSLLWLISYIVGKKSSDNNAFFLGNKKSPWWVVAIGMVGSSISGVSFISVPGMVRGIDFTYMQTVFGFFFGYLIIANVLLPLYYKLNLTSIYTYLEQRFGKYSYKTGAWFFLLSRTIGSGVRLYLVTMILQELIFNAWHIPFVVTAMVAVFLIWLYTHRSGIKTIVWTDTLQTICLVLALVLMVVQVSRQLNFSVVDYANLIIQSSHSRIFVFDDWYSKQNFFKQFFSGIFIAIVMTGLDLDMMQKNLTCKNLRDAKKNMYWYGIAFVPLNLLFLTLGAMLLMLATKNNIVLPSSPDEILPLFATKYLGQVVTFLFVIGIIAATFASSDSALASLTTSFSVDILGVQHDEAKVAERKRKYTHIGMSVLFVIIMLVFKELNNKSIIDAIYTIVSYTYGPLLGMFAFGLFTKRQTRDKMVPLVAVASPFICYGLNVLSSSLFKYQLGYELLMINGLITFGGMWILSLNYRTIEL